jgi:hypothetical protein
MEFLDARKVAFQSKVDSYRDRQNARVPIPQSVTLRAKEVAGNRRAILKQRLDLGKVREDDRQLGSNVCTARKASVLGNFALNRPSNMPIEERCGP